MTLKGSECIISHRAIFLHWGKNVDSYVKLIVTLLFRALTVVEMHGNMGNVKEKLPVFQDKLCYGSSNIFVKCKACIKPSSWHLQLLCEMM
jgi:hypothetical protein